MFVFSITSRRSFDEMNEFYDFVQDALAEKRGEAPFSTSDSNTSGGKGKAPKRPPLLAVLVGNKSDKEEEREVPADEAIRFAQEKELGGYYEVSCLLGDGVDDAFIAAAREYVMGPSGTAEAQRKREKQRKKEGKGEEGKRKGCCVS